MYIRPKLTLADVYGPGLAFHPRASFSELGWLPAEQTVRDSYTGGALTIAGDMPVLCSRRVIDERGLTLLRHAGLSVGGHLVPFSDAQDCFDKLHSMSNRVVTQHLLSPSELARDKYWIAPELLSFLNNKGNLAELVPVQHVPRRRILSFESLRSLDLGELELPLVLKAASNQSSGGGVAVRICDSRADLHSAIRYFSRCESIVMEEHLDIVGNYCVQFTTTPACTVTYLGAAEQVIDAHGKYCGNWADPRKEAPQALIDAGRTVMDKAVALGYRGFAGFDIVQLRDRRVFVLDLNFRLNGSTALLLLHASAAAVYGTPVLRLLTLRREGTWDDLISAARVAMDKGCLIPLSTYRPDEASQPRAEPRLSALVPGVCREQVIERLRELEGFGLH